MNEIPAEIRLLAEQMIDQNMHTAVRLLPMALLMLARTIPFVYMSFFLGSRVIPMPVKVFMAIALFIYMVPDMVSSASRLDFNWNYLGYLVKEMFVGIILGMLTAIPHYIVMISGMMIDYQRGASSLVSTNSILGVQDSPLGILFGYLLIYLYWLQDVPFIYIEAMANSYRVFPLDKFITASVFSFDGVLYTQLRDLFTQMFALGIQLAAPSLIILIMIDMFLGITNRLAPQVMISFLAQGFKAMLGLIVLFLGWYAIMTLFAKEAVTWSKHFQDWVLSMPF